MSCPSKALGFVFSNPFSVTFTSAMSYKSSFLNSKAESWCSVFSFRFATTLLQEKWRTSPVLVEGGDGKAEISMEISRNSIEKYFKIYF